MQMEENYRQEAETPTSISRRIVARFISSMHLVGSQLQKVDLNPHEGRLRGSAMPVEFMNIPDHPPVGNELL